MSVPRVFEDAGRIFRADTCEPLKAAIKREDVGFQGWARGNYPGTLLPPRVLPGICSVGVWDARAQQSWGLGEHCNEGLEITYLSRGSLAFSADDRDYILRDGDVTVTRPWQIHEVGDPFISASRLGWIIIDLNVRRPNQDWRWPDWILLSEAERRRLAHIIQNTDQTMWNGAELAAHFERLIGLLSEADPARNRLVLDVMLTDKAGGVLVSRRFSLLWENLAGISVPYQPLSPAEDPVQPGPPVSPPLFGASLPAGQLLGDEPDGFAIDFARNSWVIRSSTDKSLQKAGVIFSSQ